MKPMRVKITIQWMLASLLALFLALPVQAQDDEGSKRVLEPGDKLLCFGKLEAMRGMIPARTRRKRRPVVQELDTALIDEN